MRILVLGAGGMLGNAVFRYFDSQPGFTVLGSLRSPEKLHRFPEDARRRITSGVNVDNPEVLGELIYSTRPDVTINCIGLIKQLASANDPLSAIPLNAILPHRLARLCTLAPGRLIHISTDCVFSGKTGNYSEADLPDCADVYGRSKLLGEVDYPNAITLRTSIIGHALGSAHGLVDWFLAQNAPIKGYARAIFSGLPTFELARVIHNHILPRPRLRGLYHVSSSRISKFDLLSLVGRVYGHPIAIEADESVKVDRSLDSTRLNRATNYRAACWRELVEEMHRTR